MGDNAQPDFWLQVKKEYIIENLDQMIAYLEKYRYDADGNNESFITTFECLRNFVNDIFEKTSESNLCRVASYDGIEEKMLVRIVAAYLLACKKIGQDDLRCLSLIANRVLLMMGEECTCEMVEDMRRLQLNCLRRRNVTRYVFGWSSIRTDDDFYMDIFASNVSKTEFGDEGISVPLCYENKGIAIVTDERIRIVPMNYSDYRKSDVEVQFNVAGDTDICVEKEDKRKLDSFEKLTECHASMMYQQQGVKPSPVKTLKTYDLGSDTDVIAVITKADSMNVYARTVDNNYLPIAGLVYIPNYMYSVDSGFLRLKLKRGMIIKVRLQDNPSIPFRITEPFNEYYQNVAGKSAYNTMLAMYHKDYRAGRTWLASNGVLVNIIDNQDNDEVNEAVDADDSLAIKIGESRLLPSNKFVTNGTYALDNYGACDFDFDSPAEFKSNAIGLLIDGFIDNCKYEYIPDDDDDDNVESITDASLIMPMAYVLYERSKKTAASTTERYENLMAALMIAQLCEAQKDVAMISHEMNFISQIVNFAQGNDAKNLNLSHDAVLNDIRSVEYNEQIINTLKEYKQEVLSQLQISQDDEDVLSNVNGLVHASNILQHKINVQEINRIKKNIATVLGVEDMFRYEEDSATYYGEENDTLEFKSSAVFPPKNRLQNQNVPAEPQRQMWNILKAICGFLNSMSGGELLIGVRDNGYSCGIKDDIEYLYDNKKINEPSADRYIQYVKRSVDNAFRDISGTAAEPREITVSRVRYVSETNKEGHNILRIQVRSYEYGVVEFADKVHIPEDMSSAYLRSSNTTQPLSKEMKNQLETSKLSERADADTQKIMMLQAARKNQRAVILKGYHSKTEVRDRRVEAYKILLARNAVICYDLNKKSLREYKITRFSEVVTTDTKWKNFKAKYNNLRIDLFDMLEGEEPETEIVLKLGNLPYNLILEERSGAADYITENNDSDKEKYPWILSVKVFSMYGIGRFYMGLANNIKIVKGDKLKKYVKECMAKITDDLQ